MPVMRSAGRAVGTTIKGARVTARGGSRIGRWVGRKVGFVRMKGGAGEPGMMRLLDLHAASCAGDTLVTMGLAGTVFFSVPVGAARERVALYLLITMAPFAILAPVVGPLLDRFRHGRRYALAITMLGRAFLAWLISDYIGGIALYPAAFGVLALSRAYGVARSAAVPRLLPPGLGLSEAGARASIFGTLAGAAVAPLGIAAFWIGPQWPLRVASIVFIVGMVVALRLPPRADSEPPEVLPRVFQLPNRNSVKVLSGRLIVAVLSGSAALRALYGFLTLFLAFSIRSGDLTTELFGAHLSQAKALAFAIGALGVGTFVATAIGSRMRIRRPTLLQAGGTVIVAVAGLAATARYSLGLVIVMCFATAIVSGLAKLAVDASIQEQISEHVRGSAFAHSETLLMLAFVAGGAIGLIPFPGQVGIGIAAGVMCLAALRSVVVAMRLRKDRLRGSAQSDTASDRPSDTATLQLARPSDAQTMALPSSGQSVDMPDDSGYPVATGRPGGNTTVPTIAAQSGETRAATVQTVNPTRQLDAAPRRASRWSLRRKRVSSGASPGATPQGPATTRAMPHGEQPGSSAPTSDADKPSYHLYRPSSIDNPHAGPGDNSA